MYSTVLFHDTMQSASKDSTAVTTVRTYIYVCGHLAYVGSMYISEDTCKTMLLHVRVSSDDHYVQHHSKYNICLCTYMYRSCMHRMADNETYKESMQDRTRMAKDRSGCTGQLWHVLQMVQCRLLSEVSLTSVLSRSITVSSQIGCESVEGAAAPDEGSPVREGDRQGQRKGTCHYMRLTLQEVTTHCSM